MMDVSFFRELEELAQAINITSKTTYDFKGTSYDVFTGSEHNPQDAKITFDYFTAHLAKLLYQVYHCRQNMFSHNAVFSNVNYSDDRDFIESISKANNGKGTWEPGWSISKIEKNGYLAVQKNGLTLWVLPRQFIPETNEIKIGQKGYVIMVKEFRFLLPGFYMANSNAPLDDTPTIVRIYWNVDATNAASLMKNITTELNKDDISFRFKILSNPHHFTRADSAVLYVNKKYLHASKNALARVYERVGSSLKPITPLFAKKLAPGISLSEDPNNGESFGQHRSRILTESIYNSYQKNNLSTSIQEISEYFKNMGLDLEKPYLNSNSLDDYEVMLEGVFN